MKNSSFNRNYRDIISLQEYNFSDASGNNSNFSSKAVKHIMTEQFVIPPARVWDKIERILDEQENARKQTKELIGNSFNRISTAGRRKSMYLAAAAGVSLLAGLMWKVF
jgi:hypothetical protein